MAVVHWDCGWDPEVVCERARGVGCGPLRLGFGIRWPSASAPVRWAVVDVANFVVGLITLALTAVIGILAYRLQRASAERERRAERREFAASVDAWARIAEDELLAGKETQQAPYLREALKSDQRTVARMHPEFLVAHVERALERIATVPLASRGAFVDSVRVMRDWNVRHWIVDPNTSEENQAYYATGAVTVTLSGSGEGREGLSGDGGLTVE